MNHDQPLIKWWMWLQNVDVDQKSWSLTVCWPQLTFYSTQSTVDHLSIWLSNFALWGLKLDMGIIWDMWDTMKSTWGLRSSISLEETKTLVRDPLLRRSVCMIKPCVVLSNQWPYEPEETFETNCLEDVRANLRVQQLPLFNLLQPEELDWRNRHSWSEGGRGLNT